MILQLSNVTKMYHPQERVIDQVSLKLDRGQFMYVAGGTGSGKSTLLKILSLQEEPSSGNLQLFGYSTKNISASARQAVLRSLSYIPQRFELIKDLSVFDNVMLGLPTSSSVGFLKWGIHSSTRHRIMDCLEKVKLAHRAQVLVKDLSVGESQRVCIARAMVKQPLLIIADEPTGAQDHENRWVILNEFLRYQAQGAAVLVATHDQELIRRVRQPVATLRSGRLWLGDAASLCSPSN